MAQINSATMNAPGPNPRRISEGNTTDNSGAPRTEWNGVDIRNPFRTFTERENTLLGQRGLAIVEELKQARRNNRGNNGGRGRGRGRARGYHGGYGRGGRGYRWNRDRPKTITMVVATAMSTRQARMDELDRTISLSSPPMRVVLARLLNLRQVIVLGIVVDRMEIASGITALSFLILLYFCDIRNLM